MKSFLGKKILFITAHPDDESFASAGTIYKNYQTGGRNEVICATLGENGSSHLKKPVTKARLKQMRKKELLGAAKFLHMKTHILDYPDGGVKQHQKRLGKEVLALAKKIAPEIIISFGPDGMSGHLDHIAVGKVAKQVARQLQIPIMVFTRPPDAVRFSAVIKRRRRFGVYAKKIKHLPLAIKFKIDSKAKMKAISFHKSQLTNGTPFIHMPKSYVRKLMNYEYFAKLDNFYLNAL